MAASTLKITSNIRLASGMHCCIRDDKSPFTEEVSGHGMPMVGLGVYQNYTAKESCLEAFKVGYRYMFRDVI